MLTLLLALLAAVVIRLVSGEAAAWLPTLSKKIVSAAARRFSEPTLGERYREEWESTVEGIPGPLVGLAHAVSLWYHAKDVERSYAAEVSHTDIEERFGELERHVLAFTDRFKHALVSNGLTLEDICRVTKVSLRDLQALERGQWSKISMGYRSIFAYMPSPGDVGHITAGASRPLRVCPWDVRGITASSAGDTQAAGAPFRLRHVRA